MMKDKGFTLIELIAVIVVLGFIVIMIMPTFTDTINRTKEKLNDTQKQQILSAARNWGMDNLTLSDGQSVKFVTIKSLQDSGYLDNKDVKNLLNKKNIDEDTVICIRYKSNQYVYTYEGDIIEGEGTCQR